MKILSLANIDMSKTDACVVHVMDLANAFNKIGESCDILVFSREKSVVNQQNLQLVKLPRTRTWPLVFLIENIFIAFKILFLSLNKYDKIYIRMHTSLLLSIYILKFIKKKEIILECNGISEDEILISSDSLYTRLRSKLTTVTDRKACELSDKIITVTDGIKNYLHDNFGILNKKMKTVPNGVDVDTYYHKHDAALKIKNKYNISSDKIVFGFIGNFAGWQGIDLTIDAFAHISTLHDDTVLILVGDGNDYNKYKQQVDKLNIANKVIFTGRVHKDDAADYISAFDIGITLKKPIRSGYSALKLYSYLSCGTPVLGTDVYGYEVLRDNNCGILCTNDMDDIIEKMDKMYFMKKNNDLDALSLNARNVALSQFDWSSVANRIIKD